LLCDYFILFAPKNKKNLCLLVFALAKHTEYKMGKSHPDMSYTRTQGYFICTVCKRKKTDNFDTRQNEYIRGIHIAHHWSSVQFYLNAHYSVELTSGKEFEILPRFRLSTE